jgi:exosome complex component RRP41
MYRRQDLISPEGLRSDGRRPAELRTFDAKLGVFAEADGSALVSHGNTRCLCLVFGPREVIYSLRSFYLAGCEE